MSAKNTKIILISAILSFTVLNSFCTDIPKNIQTAFEQGNATLLSKYFNTSLELTLNDKTEVYSQTQAVIILKDFFRKEPPTRFTILHQGGKEASKYAIGNLTTANKTYRITLLLKTNQDKTYIHQLRIEEDAVD